MKESENRLNTAASSNSSEASQSMMHSAEAQERALEELEKSFGHVFRTARQT